MIKLYHYVCFIIYINHDGMVSKKYINTLHICCCFSCEVWYHFQLLLQILRTWAIVLFTLIYTYYTTNISAKHCLFYCCVVNVSKVKSWFSSHFTFHSWIHAHNKTITVTNNSTVSYVHTTINIDLMICMRNIVLHIYY